MDYNFTGYINLNIYHIDKFIKKTGMYIQGKNWFGSRQLSTEEIALAYFKMR